MTDVKNTADNVFIMGGCENVTLKEDNILKNMYKINSNSGWLSVEVWLSLKIGICAWMVFRAAFLCHATQVNPAGT